MTRRSHLRPQRLPGWGNPGDLPGCGSASARGSARLESCPAGMRCRLFLGACDGWGGALAVGVGGRLVRFAAR
jgi:hypothetical protein